MRSFSKLFRFTAIAAVIALVFAGCLSYTVDSVEVSIDGNATSIDAGKTIQFNFLVTASGKDTSKAQRVRWSVSSTSDGKGPVTPGTNVSPSGTLAVSVDEIYPVLYVRATHEAYTGKYDFKQIQVKGPKVGSVVLSATGNATSAAAGGNLKFSAFVAGQAPNQGLTYSVGSANNGTGAVAAGTAIAADGTLTVSANETASSLYVKAVSNSDATKSDIKEIKVVTVTGVTVAAEGGTARAVRGGSLKFNAAVAGNNNPANTVTWKVSSTAAGDGAVTAGTAIASDGTLAVAAAETATTLYVTATSTLNTAKSGSLAVVIPTVTRVSVSPANPTIKRGEGATFTARVQGTGDPGQNVTWKLDGVGGVPSATTITANGMLIVSPAETLSGLIVTATSVDDPAKFGTSMVTIPAVPAAVVPVAPAPQVQTPAQTPATGGNAYIITGSGTAFSATRGGATIGTAGSPIQDVINAIRTNAAGNAVTIQFGDGNAVLDIGTASVSFNNTGGTWGVVTLSGKITSAVTTPAGATTNLGTIYITDTVSVTITSGADIANTAASDGRAVTNASTGTVTISGGTVRATGIALAITAVGVVNINSGTISATTGSALNVNGNGTINISGNAVLTSSSGSTIIYPLLPGSSGTLNISGGTVENTGTSSSNSAIYMFSNVKININGGTVKAGAGIAVNRQGNGVVTIDGNAVVSATTGRAVHSGNNGGSVTIGGNANVSVTTGTAVYNYVSVNNLSIKGNAAVSATTGYAVYNYHSGGLSISENARVTSANTNAAQGTIHLAKPSGTAENTNVRLEMKGGTVRNTSTAATGNAIYSATTGGITISGGTVSTTATGGFAINNPGGGAVNTTGATIQGKVGT